MVQFYSGHSLTRRRFTNPIEDIDVKNVPEKNKKTLKKRKKRDKNKKTFVNVE